MDITYIFPNKDFKSVNWSLHTKKTVVYPRKSNYIFFLLIILEKILFKNKVVVFYRYLNVSNGLIKENIKLIIDLFIFFLCYLKIIEIRWINHNIDKESLNEINYITSIKKFFLIKLSSNIFILSDIFLNHLTYPTSNVKVISFGKFINKPQDDLDSKLLKEKIKKFKYKLSLKYKKKIYLGLSVNFLPKHIGTTESIKILSGNHKNYIIAFINFSKIKINSNPFVLNFNDRIKFDERNLINLIDFVYKESDDMSIPYSIYSSASACIPFFTNKESFFSKELLNYKIGFIIENSEDIVNKLKLYNKKKSIFYLKTKTWKNAASKLFK